MNVLFGNREKVVVFSRLEGSLVGSLVDFSGAPSFGYLGNSLESLLVSSVEEVIPTTSEALTESS